MSNADVYIDVNADDGIINYNGTDYTHTYDFMSDKQTCIFDVGRGDTEMKYIPAASGSKFYRWIMKKDGVIIHDYRPALDVNFNPCVVDLITNDAFYNVLEGNLTWE